MTDTTHVQHRPLPPQSPVPAGLLSYLREEGEWGRGIVACREGGVGGGGGQGKLGQLREAGEAGAALWRARGWQGALARVCEPSRVYFNIVFM